MNLPIEIFREYDVRGIYPDQINKENFLYLGKALGTFLLKKNIKSIVIGHDSRGSSHPLAEAMIEGLVSTGASVTYVGITSQPALHYFTFLEGVQAGINITASHNPKEYNGFKVDYSHAMPFTNSEYKEVNKIVLSEEFATGKGEVLIKDLNKFYVKELSDMFKIKNKFKVAVNCGNSASSQMAPVVLKNIGVEIVEHECVFEPDFPHGVPDPENTNFIKNSSKLVLESKADLGVGFDGDGDRFGAVDEKGNHISTDKLLILFAKDISSKKKDAKFLYDVKCSSIVESMITKFGGHSEMMRTGRTYFIPKTLQKEADLAAEYSGHFFFADDYYGFDDGLYTACRLIKFLDDYGKPLSAHFKDFPQFESTPEFQIPCPDNVKFDLVKDFYETVKLSGEFNEISTIDGVRVKISEFGWFLIRAKNTSPFLTLRAEGKDKKELEEILDKVLHLLSKYKTLDLNSVKYI